jgi:5-methylthioadenosine/S-adenosylhomocysteine deaminase
VNEIGKYEREVARVVRDIGLRVVMAENVRDSDVQDVRPGVTERTFDPVAAERCIEAATAFIEEWHGQADGRITCRFGPNAPDTCAEATLLRVKALAEARGLGLHTHLAQVPGEREYIQKAHGCSPVKYLSDLGYLSPSLVAAHCVFMSEDDVALFAESGAHMSHTAYRVGKRGYFPPMTSLYARQASVALGSDWLSNDMFKIMRAAILLARQQSGSVGGNRRPEDPRDGDPGRGARARPGSTKSGRSKRARKPISSWSTSRRRGSTRSGRNSSCRTSSTTPTAATSPMCSWTAGR